MTDTHIRCGAAICFCRDVENVCCIRWNGMAFYAALFMYEYGWCLFDLTSIRIRLHDDAVPQPHNDTRRSASNQQRKQLVKSTQLKLVYVKRNAIKPDIKLSNQCIRWCAISERFLSTVASCCMFRLGAESIALHLSVFEWFKSLWIHLAYLCVCVCVCADSETADAKLLDTE